MSSEESVMELPDDWRNRPEAILDEITRRWQVADRRGEDPTPQDTGFVGLRRAPMASDSLPWAETLNYMKTAVNC